MIEFGVMDDVRHTAHRKLIDVLAVRTVSKPDLGDPENWAERDRPLSPEEQVIARLIEREQQQRDHERTGETASALARHDA